MRSRAAAALILALAGGMAARAEEGPRIAVEPPSFDFGEVLQKRTLRKEFTIRNYGGADLVLLGATTTCGCATSDIRNRTLKPGASTVMSVTLETRTSQGRLARSILVKSNDAAHSPLEVKVVATVRPEETPE